MNAKEEAFNDTMAQIEELARLARTGGVKSFRMAKVATIQDLARRAQEELDAIVLASLTGH